MSASKIPVAPTNLRERIAALEQRNATLDQRPTSPAPPSATSTSPSAGGLREKIAKFERKGGVPVPRGSFGLGAPPSTEGQPRRKGELYGNRIPVPTRNASSGTPPISRSGTPRLAGSPRSNRRSFSLSSISGDFDDGTDYSPLTSPTFTTPPDSPPDSVTFTPPFTPEMSPSPTSLVDPNAFKKPLLRGTDFAKALEIARKTEGRQVDKMSDVFGIRQEEGLDTPTPQGSSLPSSVGEEETDSPEPTPAIVVYSEDAPPVIVQESPAIDAHSFTVPQDAEVVEDTVQEVAAEPVPQVPEVKSALSQYDMGIKVESVAGDDNVTVPTEPKFPSAEMGAVEPARPISEPPVDTPLLPIDHSSDIAIVSAEPPSGVTHAVERTITPVAVAVAPEISVTEEPNKTMEHVPPPINVPSPESFSRYSAASITIVIESPSSAPPPFTPDSEPSPTLSEKTLFAPAPVEIEEVVPPTSLELSQSLAASDEKETQDVPSAPVVVISEPPPVAEEISPTGDISLPSLSPTVVLTNSEHEETKVEVSAPTTPVIELPTNLAMRKSALILDADRLNDDSLMSPPSQGSVLASSALEGNLSVSDVLGGYFGSGKSAPNGQVEEKVPEPVVQQPLQSPSVTRPKERERVATSAPPSSFLSPPGTGTFSPAPSASSFASLSSLDTGSITSSRPLSMIETSPSRVTLAHRLTPATSRGVPMFVPPTSTLPHKSDFSHFPPTPEAARENFGSVTVHHKPSRSYSHPNTHMAHGAAAEEQSDERPTFTAVVHGKVREGPASASASRTKGLPQTPKTNRVNRATILQTPLSPGTGELAALLQHAIFLEDTLERGEDPGEAAKRLAEEEKQEKVKKEQEAAAAAKERQERERAALAQAEAEAKKEGSSSAKLKHTFLIPLSRARTAHRKEVTSSVVEASTNLRQPYPEVVRPKSANTELPSRRLEVNTDSLPHRPPTPVESKDKTTELPSKSPRSRFASFRRLGSLSRTSKDGSRNSTSMSSEISSEDSAPAVTPPDHASEFSVISTPVSEFGQTGNGMSWPSLSPKKSTGSISRAASFAEKIWSRARTKSGGSTFSTKSSMMSAATELTPERAYDRFDRVSSIGPPPSFSLPPLPTVAEPESESSITPPTQSASLNKPRALPAIPSSATTPATPYSPYTHQTQPSPKIDYLSPVIEDPSRPESWMSASSFGSMLPSPLFDKDLWDAFPAVPGGEPMTTSGAYAPGAGPSFDSALLSSAIHLASTHKGTSTYNAVGGQPR